jgi:predicted GIY-YIG superfamily endonuclease
MPRINHDSKLWESIYLDYKKNRSISFKQRLKYKATKTKQNKKPKEIKVYQLYALKLANNKYYVGITKNPQRRFNAHYYGKGSWWTTKYKPISIIETRITDTTIESVAAKLEDKMTLEYAKKYGFDNVRGGGYCQKHPNW